MNILPRVQWKKYLILFSLFLVVCVVLYVTYRNNVDVFVRHPATHSTARGITLADGLNPAVATTNSTAVKDGLNPAVATTSSTPIKGLGFYDLSMPDLVSHSNHSSLYPNPLSVWDDRVIQQLAYAPLTQPKNVKTMLLLNGAQYYTGMGRKSFIDFKCKVTSCLLTDKVEDALSSDLVLLTAVNYDISRKVLNVLTSKPRRLDQVWASYLKESTVNEQNVFGSVEFNWTVAYTSSATIPALNGQFYPIKAGVTYLQQTKNYAKGKLAKVLWIVSHCKTKNKREEYVTELSKHIHVDIYGGCGKPLCKEYMGDCMIKLIERYKFYLAFENSNCDTYVTEKFFRNALSNNIVPVVMGASPEYYRHISPPHSYINVDDFASPRLLAAYLHVLDGNHTLYNEYFKWKGAWRLIPDRNLICRLCAMLHAPRQTVINTFDKWKRSERCRQPTYKQTLENPFGFTAT